MATNISSVTNVPMFAGRKPFMRHPDGVRGDDRPELDLVLVGELEDSVVREPGEERLGRLDEAAPRRCSPGDVADLVPEVLDPARDVDAEQVEDNPEDRDTDHPGEHLAHALPARRWR